MCPAWALDRRWKPGREAAWAARVSTARGDTKGLRRSAGAVIKVETTVMERPTKGGERSSWHDGGKGALTYPPYEDATLCQMILRMAWCLLNGMSVDGYFSPYRHALASVRNTPDS